MPMPWTQKTSPEKDDQTKTGHVTSAKTSHMTPKAHLTPASTSSFHKVIALDSGDDRGHWGSKAEFMLSCIGLSVGLGNVWRFPTLAYENGGAAFFIPYIILQLLIGKPMYFMELAMGQFSGMGPVGVWSLNPSGKGIGVSMAIISLITTIYYNIIMSYTVFYMFASMQTTLPWTQCTPEGMAKHCWVRVGQANQYSIPLCGNATVTNTSLICKCVDVAHFDFNSFSTCYSDSATYADLKNLSEYSGCEDLVRCTRNTRTPADLYFYDNVIQVTDSFSEPLGLPIWYLVMCLLFSWIVVVLCLLKGIKSSGKVVYFTATFPYLILLVLMVGGLTQTGSGAGVNYFLNPNVTKLAELKVWKEAAGQMFFSLSISFGAIIMFGSYNQIHNNVYVDSLIISATDIITSFLAGIVVFSTLGAMSYESGLPIEQVATKGYGLAFVAYPEALSRLPVPHLWSILFFLMMFTLGLDSEFAFLETVLTCLQDAIPRLRAHKMALCAVAGVCCFIVALFITTPGGYHLLHIMDAYGASYPVIICAFAELVAVMWVYGVNRFMKDIVYMIGYAPHPGPYWTFCWGFAAPVLIGGIFLGYMTSYENIQYRSGKYHEGAPVALGWTLTVITILPIPVFFVVSVVKVKNEPNILQRIKLAMQPSSDWRPQRWSDYPGKGEGHDTKPIEATKDDDAKATGMTKSDDPDATGMIKSDQPDHGYPITADTTGRSVIIHAPDDTTKDFPQTTKTVKNDEKQVETNNNNSKGRNESSKPSAIKGSDKPTWVNDECAIQDA